MEEFAKGHPHGAMRRKNREITDLSEIKDVLNKGKIMRIALTDGLIPFLVPVFYAYDGTAVYFHSAKAGTKVELMKKNNNICFEVSVDHGIIEDEMPCDFEAKHRTVIGIGKAVFVEDEAEKVKALNMIVGQFTSKKFEFPENNLKATLVVRIDIASMKGKKHGF
jgi:uncharacterized protein